MMAQRQLAELVTDALKETNPGELARLLSTGKLLPLLKHRIDDFKQQFVRQIQGQDYRQNELATLESLLPLLTEFPPGPRVPWTDDQEQALQNVLDSYESLTAPRSYLANSIAAMFI